MKILLFGSSGMLGRYVLNVLSDNYTVLRVNKDTFNIEHANWEHLRNIIESNLEKDDVIINCSGIIPQKFNDNNLNLHKYICLNTAFPHKLNEISILLGLRFIHITTDCVYNGLIGNYSKNDKHNADTLYGITKSLGEPYNATIIRTSIIGEELLGKKSLLEWVKSNKNGEICGYANHKWNGVSCLTLANIISEIISKKLFWKGVNHICSPNVVSKYELCYIINEIYNLNINVKEIQSNETKNMTLNDNDNENKYDFNIDLIYKQIKDLKDFKLLK